MDRAMYAFNKDGYIKPWRRGIVVIASAILCSIALIVFKVAQIWGFFETK
jgi:hypothetical protein